MLAQDAEHRDPPAVRVAVRPRPADRDARRDPLDLRDEPERRVALTPCCAASAATPRTVSACGPSGPRTTPGRSGGEAARRRLRPTSVRPRRPATRVSGPRAAHVDAHPVRRADPVVPALRENDGQLGVALVGHRANHAVGRAAVEGATLELGVELGHRSATDVEPEDAAVVRLVAEIAVADDLAVLDGDDRIPGEVEGRRLRPPALDGVRIDFVTAAKLARGAIDHRDHCVDVGEGRRSEGEVRHRPEAPSPRRPPARGRSERPRASPPRARAPSPRGGRGRACRRCGR